MALSSNEIESHRPLTGYTLSPKSFLGDLNPKRNPEKLKEFLTNSEQFSRTVLKSSLFSLSFRILLVMTPCFGEFLGCSNSDPGMIVATGDSSDITGNAITNAEKALLKIQTNDLGFPISYETTFELSPSYPDRAYLFDLGSDLLFCAQNKEKWSSWATALAAKLVTQQNADGSWANAYGNSGISDPTKNLGPIMVAARGVLAWADGTLTDSRYLAARKTADLWLDDPLKQISVNEHYALRQNPDKSDDTAATEENGRAALLFIDLYRYLEETDPNAALKYRKAAESVLLAYISLKGAEVYPLGGILNSGAADWTLPSRQGGDGQSLMLQAIGYYISVFPNDPDTTIQTDWGKRKPVMDWILRTFGNSENSLLLPGGTTLSLPKSLAKRVSNEGKGENQVWVELTAQTAILLKAFFINDFPGIYDDTYASFIETLKNIQLPDGTFPYAPWMTNGYRTPPNWNSLDRPLNWPYSSLQATIASVSALKENFPFTYLALRNTTNKEIRLAFNDTKTFLTHNFLGMTPTERAYFYSIRPSRPHSSLGWAS